MATPNRPTLGLSKHEGPTHGRPEKTLKLAQMARDRIEDADSTAMEGVIVVDPLIFTSSMVPDGVVWEEVPC